MTWLLLGANGQLGLSLQDVLTHLDISFVATGREEVDITNISDIHNCVEKIRPSVIVNMAAWTDVEAAESHSVEVFRINAEGAENVAKEAALWDCPLIHISTDYIFDGNQNTPYKVDDQTHPLSVYGASKLRGEKLVQAAHPSGAWILRTAWLYSQYGKNFAKTIARKGLAGETLSVINDSFGQPTSALELARQIVKLVQHRPPGGIFHATNDGQASWFDFASAIIEPIAEQVTISPVPSSSFQTIARRPQYSILDHSMWTACNITPMSHWEESLKEIRELIFDSVKDYRS
jgi:dTDP-4-dehydrorhamnose reductase